MSCPTACSGRRAIVINDEQSHCDNLSMGGAKYSVADIRSAVVLSRTVVVLVAADVDNSCK